MTQHESTYNRLIGDAAEALAKACRANPFQTKTVWAIPTMGNAAGQILVAETPPEETLRRPPEFWPRVIRPNDNGASVHATWGSVPYSGMFDILWRACRREPILPVE